MVLLQKSINKIAKAKYPNQNEQMQSKRKQRELKYNLLINDFILSVSNEIIHVVVFKILIW